VQLSAVPLTNYRFSKWAGDVAFESSFDDSISIAMDGNKDLTAKFFTQCGDVNGDLNLTPADSQMAFDIYMGRVGSPTEAQLENADVNSDGTKIMPNVTPGDAHAIFKKYLGQEELPGDCSCASRADASSSAHMFGIPGSDAILAFEDTESEAGKRLLVPVLISGISQLRAFGFDVAYPTSLMEFSGVARTDISKDFMKIDGFEAAPGVVRIGGYREAPLQVGEPTALVILIFQVKADAQGQSLFIFSKSVDDLEGVLLKPGRVQVFLNGMNEPKPGPHYDRTQKILKK
jgi:hypothetical protein